MSEASEEWSQSTRDEVCHVVAKPRWLSRPQAEAFEQELLQVALRKYSKRHAFPVSTRVAPDSRHQHSHSR